MKSGNVILSLVVDYGQRSIVAIRATGTVSWLRQNKMARTGNGRRGGGRTGGRNGGRNRTPRAKSIVKKEVFTLNRRLVCMEPSRHRLKNNLFTFEPEVRAAIAREFTDLMKVSLPGLLAEAL
ncbi:hypothetical protein L1987_06716 [Smallanthus sonchifolius]|uniref:Uncharacterized protein n=1 Tax=Smallanthus sonchifolius TaxID=185202 RepID=A0ACB9JZ32_9ASTR|nr:hypothetical protein L1987_06716 [Smallanthus sonchifolius]